MSTATAPLHVLIETWGCSPDEVTATVYRERAAGETACQACIAEHLAGSDRDIDNIMADVRADGWSFEHGDGFIELRTIVPDALPDAIAPQPLHEALPPPLVDAIRARMSHRPRDVEEMLSWNAASAVGADCRRLALLTNGLVDSLDVNAVDVQPIWDAAAHQCLIYAFS